jgi:hypothetical protein
LRGERAVARRPLPCRSRGIPHRQICRGAVFRRTRPFISLPATRLVFSAASPRVRARRRLNPTLSNRRRLNFQIARLQRAPDTGSLPKRASDGRGIVESGVVADRYSILLNFHL